MPSKAYNDFSDRLKDVQQLLEAHKALTQFKKAQAAAQNAGGALAQVAAVVQALVTAPGKGRPAEVGAINRSAFTLLCSHLQGFVWDLHSEAAQLTLKGKASDIPAVIKLVLPRSSNPHADVIEKIFSGIGIYEVMGGIKWKKCAETRVRTRLTSYIEERNKIAHGKRPKVTKAKVLQFKDFVELLAEHLDESVAKKVQLVTGTKPW